MAESPKRTFDSLAAPEPDLGPASQKAKTSDNDDAPDVLVIADKGEVVDLSSDDDSDGGSDRAPEELPPGLRPKTVSGRGLLSDFMIDYALDVHSMCNEIGRIARPLVRVSLASPTADTKQKQRVLLEATREYLKACVADIDAHIDILDKY